MMVANAEGSLFKFISPVIEPKLYLDTDYEVILNLSLTYP